MTILVVTAIYGGYETLRPIGPEPDIDWVCVTDDRALIDDTQGWRVVYKPQPEMHPNRAAKLPKIMPWLYNGDAEASVWIDGSFAPLSETFAVDALKYADPIAQFRHPLRDCIYVEAEHSIPLEKYAGEPIASQVAQYRRRGHPEHWGLWATGVIARQHTEATRDLARRWYADCLSYSYQDQISQPPALRGAGLRPTELPGDYYANDWLAHLPSGRH